MKTLPKIVYFIVGQQRFLEGEYRGLPVNFCPFLKILGNITMEDAILAVT